MSREHAASNLCFCTSKARKTEYLRCIERAPPLLRAHQRVQRACFFSFRIYRHLRVLVKQLSKLSTLRRLYCEPIREHREHASIRIYRHLRTSKASKRSKLSTWRAHYCGPIRAQREEARLRIDRHFSVHRAISARRNWIPGRWRRVGARWAADRGAAPRTALGIEGGFRSE